MIKPKTDLEIIEDFSRHFCIVCKRRIAVVCGTSIVHIGGCCVGVYHKKEKTMYVRTLNSHFHCYVSATIKRAQKQLTKSSIKLNWDFSDIKKIVEGDSSE